MKVVKALKAFCCNGNVQKLILTTKACLENVFDKIYFENSNFAIKMANACASAFAGYIFLAVLLQCVDNYNYCGKNVMKDLCNNNEHFMCNPSTIGNKGTFLANPPMTKKMRDRFLDVHNELRNTIASGDEVSKKANKNYPSATRLRELIWDAELAYMSLVHTRQCIMKHDKCHNTARFKHSGQNLAVMASSKTEPILDAITTFVTNWYLEKDLCEDPEEFPKKYISGMSEVGHFSAMVNERVSRVGCAISYCDTNSMHTYHCTCNYDYTNMMNKVIYTTGDAASDCEDWETAPSAKFSNLCKNSGKIFK